MLKKPSLIISSYTSVQNSYCSPYQPCSNSPSHNRLRSKPAKKPSYHYHLKLSHGYATIHDSRHHAPSNDDHLIWPEALSVHSVPTPYEIFGQKQGSPYSKRRFYELVKLYHPDSHSHHSHHHSRYLPDPVRLERYRLVVKANEILSDPVKRSAYDRYGTGWSGRPEFDSCRARYSPGGRYRRSDPSPFANATWEDWEKWYHRNDDNKGAWGQTPVYSSHGTFISIVALITALGGYGQVTRIESWGETFSERIEHLNNECTQQLNEHRKESTKKPTKEQRVQNFLKHRDPAKQGITDPREEAYRRMFPDPEVCSGENIENRTT
ncbi:MAG: hypothetical protein M1834_001431 [Cirrosporium novae-zelandiae]|nr:MAG: hypothetical protein M1834_001431 [Cirrosporium novae-zelandiae]